MPAAPTPASRASRCRGARLAACALLLQALCAGAAEAPPAAIDYHLGDGLHIPGSGWTLGGYATGSVNRLDDASARLNLDNLSLFVWWEGESRWKLFSEIEYENFAATRKATGGRDDYVSLERAYVDYALTDTADVRAGKFLTPVGRWNLIHATPLVWTTSRPLTTTRAFPTNMTGLMLTGTLPSVAGGLEYTLYGASSGDLRPNPDVDPFSEAIGAHVTLPLPQHGQLGLSYANFEQAHSRPERKQLVGLDYVWTRNRYELSAEAVYRFSDRGGRADEKGAFVQLAAPLSDRLYAVGRAEIYRGAHQPDATELWVTGLTFRVSRALVLKAEWIGGSHNTIHAPTGFMSSISILL